MSQTRRLAAILAADVAGYSRLMGRSGMVQPTGCIVVRRTAAIGVRRAKAALSSGCKAHPAIRSSRKQSEQSWR